MHCSSNVRRHFCFSSHQVYPADGIHPCSSRSPPTICSCFMDSSIADCFPLCMAVVIPRYVNPRILIPMRIYVIIRFILSSKKYLYRRCFPGNCQEIRESTFRESKERFPEAITVIPSVSARREVRTPQSCTRRKKETESGGDTGTVTQQQWAQLSC